jgi:hypothetical protein
MLIILPNVFEKEHAEDASLLKDPLRPKFIERADSLPQKYERAQQ